VAYDFNVANGRYLVNLYFANTAGNTSSVGGRVFDIALEHSIVFHGFDQVAAAGGNARAVVRSAVVDVADGDGLQIELLRGSASDPAIKAIEVLVELGSGDATTSTLPTTASTSTTTTLPAATCGDGICSGNGENCFSCPLDCRCMGRGCDKGCCGDGVCWRESIGNCPVDCAQ
jgi:hypothetical protein